MVIFDLFYSLSDSYVNLITCFFLGLMIVSLYFLLSSDVQLLHRDLKPSLLSFLIPKQITGNSLLHLVQTFVPVIVGS